MRLQRRPISRIGYIVCDDSWEDINVVPTLKKTPITPYPILGYPVNLDNSTNNVLIPLDSWTSGLLEYKLPLSINGKKAYELKENSLDDQHNNAFREQTRKTRDHDKLRVVVFPISLAGGARRWFKTYEDYKDDWIYEWNENVPWVYDKPWLDNGIWKELKPEDSKLKDKDLRNKVILNGLTSDDESGNDCWKRWKSHEIYYHNYDEGECENETHEEGHELCSIKTREVPVCQIKRYKMIKYSFKDEEEYVAVKEDEYDDLTITSEEACRAYKEIFWMMDEGLMVT
ncbi:hypothetical protein Tco_0931683 [Tanacetum coccineum]